MFSNRKLFKINGKDSAHKKAIVKSMIVELVRNERIKTTPKKAKVVKQNFDKLVTKVKKGSDHANAQVLSALGNNQRAFDRLKHFVETQFNDRNSGYTRVVKTISRAGDNAQQAYVMLVNSELKAKKSKISALLEKREEKETKKPAKKAKSAQPKADKKEKAKKPDKDNSSKKAK
jgi:large subunit ribosomal protein L17